MHWGWEGKASRVAGNAKDPRRSVISKISAILLTLSEGNGPTLTEIAAWSELPLSTVHRLTSELAAWGLLERDERGRYRAGSPLRALGVDARSPITTNDGLRDRIAPVMDDLFRTTGAQVRAGWLDATNVAYVEKVCGHVPVTQPSAAGRLPAHATALGKTLMAFSPVGVVNAIIARGLVQYTDATITRPERLRWELRRIRTLRITLCDRELNDGWSGVAAPVFGPGGAVLAAIELRVHDLARELPILRAPLAVAAACVSRDLAAQKPADVHPASWLDSRRDLVSIPTVRAEVGS
jgi:DNA-binding IclR family transcriptional regulator